MQNYFCHSKLKPSICQYLSNNCLKNILQVSSISLPSNAILHFWSIASLVATLSQLFLHKAINTKCNQSSFHQINPWDFCTLVQICYISSARLDFLIPVVARRRLLEQQLNFLRRVHSPNDCIITMIANVIEVRSTSLRFKLTVK